MPRSKPQKISYSDELQEHYSYMQTEPVGRNFDVDFAPELTPKEMLSLGVFGGDYFIGVKGGIPSDLPTSWFKGVTVSLSGKKEAQHNYFKLRASQPLSVWIKKGWIHSQDPHGWFQWYCRYYLGRRTDDDDRQIKRWRAFKRHVAQVKKHCKKGDVLCRPKQRQALLHWAYDSINI